MLVGSQWLTSHKRLPGEIYCDMYSNKWQKVTDVISVMGDPGCVSGYASLL